MNKGLPKDVLFIIFNLMDRKSRITAGRVNRLFYALSRHPSWNWKQQAESWIPWKTPFKLDLLYSLKKAWRAKRVCIVHSNTLFSDHTKQVEKLKKVACFRSASAAMKYDWSSSIDYYSTTQWFVVVQDGTKYIFVVFNPHYMKQTYQSFYRVVYPTLLRIEDCVCCLFFEPGARATETLLNMDCTFFVTERIFEHGLEIDHP